MDCKWFLYQKQMEKRTETLDKNAKVYYYGTRYEREFERRKDMVQEEKLKALDAALAQIEKLHYTDALSEFEPTKIYKYASLLQEALQSNDD